MQSDFLPDPHVEPHLLPHQQEVGHDIDLATFQTVLVGHVHAKGDLSHPGHLDISGVIELVQYHLLPSSGPGLPLLPHQHLADPDLAVLEGSDPVHTPVPQLLDQVHLLVASVSQHLLSPMLGDLAPHRLLFLQPQLVQLELLQTIRYFKKYL